MTMSFLKYVVALFCFIAVPISAQNDKPVVSPTVPVSGVYVGKYYGLFQIFSTFPSMRNQGRIIS